jgi:sulfur-carrier protein adenylyltransferase/sulfurtransferase
MQSEQLRYACQMNLPNFTETTQLRLKNAKVLVVGAGGLGCPSAQYLASTGIGTLGIADFDTISLGNLHRQILYTPIEIGQYKASVAAQKLQVQNPDITILPILEKITTHNVLQILQHYDLVIDGTDNFDTRYLLNDACVLLKKPLVYGAIYQYEGQVAVWNVQNEDGTFSPNYRDIFPEVDASQVPNCAEGGVIPTIAGIIGCMQANEAIKYFTKIGELLAGKILILDALSLQSRIIKTAKKTQTHITQLPKIIDIQLLTIHDFLKNKEKYTLIDVRKKAERELFDIGGLHFPLDELVHHLTGFSSEKPIVCYCASGKRSAEAVKKILSSNFPLSVFSLDGGIKTYQEYTIFK